MSANRIFLVCSHHKNPEDALLLATRTHPEFEYDPADNARAAARWFEKHAICGRGKDHFQLAYQRPQDWDQSPPAENSVAGGVRLALLDGGKPQ